MKKLVAAAILAPLILTGTTTGLAYASSPDSGTQYSGCVNVHNNRILQDAYEHSVTCSTGTFGITWNQVGATGPPGPQGPTGPTGPAGTARDTGAVVSVGQGGPSFYSEGLKGWQSVTSQGTGDYCLVPDATSNVDNTTLLLSGGSPGAGGLGFVTWGGYCTVSGSFGLTVFTTSTSGSPDNDIPFVAAIP